MTTETCKSTMHKISNLKYIYIYILFYDDYRRWDYLICFTCYYNMNMKIQKDKTIITVIFSVVHFFPSWAKHRSGEFCCQTGFGWQCLKRKQGCVSLAGCLVIACGQPDYLTK